MDLEFSMYWTTKAMVGYSFPLFPSIKSEIIWSSFLYINLQSLFLTTYDMNSKQISPKRVDGV